MKYIKNEACIMLYTLFISGIEAEPIYYREILECNQVTLSRYIASINLAIGEFHLERYIGFREIIFDKVKGIYRTID